MIIPKIVATLKGKIVKETIPSIARPHNLK